MNTLYITCRECGANNAPNVKRCIACGTELSSLGRPYPANTKKSKSIIIKFRDWLNQSLGRKAGVEPPRKETTWLVPEPQIHHQASQDVEMISMAKPIKNTGLTTQTSLSSVPEPVIHPTKVGQRITQRYQVQEYRKHPTGRTLFYDAVDLVCPTCQHQYENLPQGGSCQDCSTALNTVLIHERQQLQHPQAQDSLPNRLVNLGQLNHPSILYHRELLSFTKMTYSIVNHPGRWGFVVPGNRTMDEIIAIITQIGKALNFLHQQNLSLIGQLSGPDVIESWVALPGINEVRLADLSTCFPMTQHNKAVLVSQDIYFLAQVLFYLTSGILSQNPDPSLAPIEVRPFLERSINGQYPSPMAFMQDLSGTPASPVRQLYPSHGQATHPGRQHTVNEDAIITFTYNKQQSGQSVPVGFYLIADGMGGHDAGDLASRTVNQIVTNWVLEVQILPDLRKTTRKLTSENIPADILKNAISEANNALQQHAQFNNSDLGSTVTAALLIGDTATIVNVGDSRTYRLRDNQLVQITRDHSIVARLVESNVISSEEVRKHPRRNEIYRSLGHHPDVKVDTFTVPLQRGDRLILCSDGLWEMVLDDDIKKIIETARTPQEACDQLTTAANTAGGEDNISVIVVEIE